GDPGRGYSGLGNYRAPALRLRSEAGPCSRGRWLGQDVCLLTRKRRVGVAIDGPIVDIPASRDEDRRVADGDVSLAEGPGAHLSYPAGFGAGLFLLPATLGGSLGPIRTSRLEPVARRSPRQRRPPRSVGTERSQRMAAPRGIERLRGGCDVG